MPKSWNAKRFAALAVAAAFLLTAVPLTVFSLKLPAVKSLNYFSDEEMKTASDISNLTGGDVEDILAMKDAGKTWNEILEKLKKSSGANSAESKEERNDLLAQSGLEEADIKELKKEGFSETEITDAKLYAERITFELNEIVSAKQMQSQNPSEGLNLQSTENNDSPYAELAGRLDEKLAVTFLLKLNNDFGGQEQVMDEYLYSIQAGLNLEEYIADKTAYQKERDEQSAGMDQSAVITVRRIEEKMLEVIQNSNKLNKTDKLTEVKSGQLETGIDSNKEGPEESAEGSGAENTDACSDSGSPISAGTASGKTSVDFSGKSIESIIPSDILPENESKSVRPENPADAARNEINGLNPELN